MNVILDMITIYTNITEFVSVIVEHFVAKPVQQGMFVCPASDATEIMLMMN